jgi:hypothetical protein
MSSPSGKMFRCQITRTIRWKSITVSFSPSSPMVGNFAFSGVPITSVMRPIWRGSGSSGVGPRGNYKRLGDRRASPRLNTCTSCWALRQRTAGFRIRMVKLDTAVIMGGMEEEDRNKGVEVEEVYNGYHIWPLVVDGKRVWAADRPSSTKGPRLGPYPTHRQAREAVRADMERQTK